MVAVSLSSPAQSHSSTAKCIPTKLPRGGMERAAVSMFLSGTVSIASSSIYGNTAGWGGSNVHVNGGTVCTWATTLTGVSGTFGYVFRENVRDVLNKHNDTHVTRTLDYLSTQC